MAKKNPLRDYYRGMNPLSVPSNLVGDTLALLTGTPRTSQQTPVRAASATPVRSVNSGHSTPQRASRPGESYGTPDTGIRNPGQRRRDARGGSLSRGQQADADRYQALADAWQEDGITNTPASYTGGQLQDRLSQQDMGVEALPDPYDEFLQQYRNDLASSYDSQIQAIQGLGPIFQGQAQEAQGNIGGFFDYAGDVAREGIPVTQETYGTATSNVDAAYDQLASRLEGMPSQLTDIAAGAAGGAVSPSVAESVSASAAPFMAAGETSRASATANLAQHSSAGENYLNQLASSTGAEAGMHQSAVESALQQQLQLVSYRGAELEGAKHRALMEVSADIAGSSSERMAQAALSSALGLDIPQGVDPMQYLQGQGMMQGLASSGSVDPMDALRYERGVTDLEAARLNLAQDSDPNFQSNQILGGTTQATQHHLQNLLSPVERRLASDPNADPKKLSLYLLEALDAYVGAGRLAPDTVGMGDGGAAGTAKTTEAELRELIRNLYGS